MDSRTDTTPIVAAKRIYVFGDESGDQGFDFDGGSGEYFIFALIVVDDPTQLFSAVARFRDDLARQGKAGKECKFSKMTRPGKREAWLRCLMKVPFQACALVLNKKRMPNDERPPSNEVYQEFLRRTLDRHRDHISNANITMDEINETEVYKKQIRTYLRQRLNRGPGMPVFRDFGFQVSHANYGVQAADAFCGSLHHAFVKNNDHYLSIVRKRMKIEQM